MRTPGARRFLPLLFLAVTLDARAGVPSSYMLVPSSTTVPAIRHLAERTGAIAIVITTQGEEKALTVTADQPDTLSGNLIDNSIAGQAVTFPGAMALPFDSLALIYYTEPASGPLQSRIPAKGAFPEPRRVGNTERALSCELLDTELSRGEALRWVARGQGATPFTGAEKTKLHAKHIAEGVALVALETVLVVGMVRGGGVVFPSGGDGCAICDTNYEGAWHVDREGFRWAISAIDERVEGLLRLKKQKQCGGRGAMQADSTDLTILGAFDAWKVRQRSPIDQHALLAKRTEAFDELGPRVVMTPEAAYPVPPGEVVEQLWDPVMWHSGVSFFKVPFSKQTSGTESVLALTNKSIIVDFKGHPNYAGVEAMRVHIAYEDIESVTLDHWMLARDVVITRRDGHIDSLTGVGWAREMTKSVAEAVRAKVRALEAERSYPAQSAH